jgi:hypothetical protein
MLKKLVDNASSRGNHVKGALADGTYESDNNFRCLSRNHIKPGIKTRTKVRLTPYHTRDMSVLKQQANLKDGNVA